MSYGKWGPFCLGLNVLTEPIMAFCHLELWSYFNQNTKKLFQENTLKNLFVTFVFA